MGDFLGALPDRLDSSDQHKDLSLADMMTHDKAGRVLFHSPILHLVDLDGSVTEPGQAPMIQQRLYA
ncbi:hypothetical protein PG994_000723 [Apiospora phragmitis]|uniref:Uncharacterized protein n=1 Tax=Apiospora phragmitis TaxID=2905665 RepID=A0ABR1X755_9PEZI